jgi:beta-glucosidase
VVRAAVRASLVLLKNDNTALPIPKTATVAIWGQGGNDVGIQCGGWTVSWQGSTGNPTSGTTILQGCQAMCPNVTFASNGGTAAGNVTHVIAVLSENPYAEKGGLAISLTGSEFATGSNSSVINSLAAAKSAGKKVIVVIMAGRPLDIGPVINNCDAVVWASLPGTEGRGIAEVFFNDQNAHFTGKLPISWPNTSATPATGGARYALGTGRSPF